MDENNKFDFSQPVDFSKFDPAVDAEYRKEVKEEVKTKPVEKKPKNMKNTQVLFVVFVLILGLIVAGSFSITQTLRIQELESKLGGGPEVLGVNNSTAPENIIAGGGFSIIVDQKTPEGFKLETDFGKIDYLGKQGSTTSLLASKEKGGAELLTGMEVQVVEYDNSLKEDAFLTKVQEFLGGTYSLASEKVKVSEQFELSKFTPRSKDDAVYYATLTADNYYLIRVYNQTAKYNEFAEYSRFTDKLVPGLWLN